MCVELGLWLWLWLGLKPALGLVWNKSPLDHYLNLDTGRNAGATLLQQAGMPVGDPSRGLTYPPPPTGNGDGDGEPESSPFHMPFQQLQS